MSLLRLEGVTLVRGGRMLVEEFDLSLEAGEAVHLVGPNGIGKSSLLRLAAGFLRPASGRVEAPSSLALADDCLALDRGRPLGQALAFWGGDIAKGLDAMGIGGLADTPVRLLSTGQARRARLARVIASGAGLWLLDEPLNGLDADGVERIAAAVAAHRAAGGGVLAASHLPLGEDWRRVAIGGAQ